MRCRKTIAGCALLIAAVAARFDISLLEALTASQRTALGTVSLTEVYQGVDHHDGWL
jgi:hypothetical protein